MKESATVGKTIEEKKKSSKTEATNWQQSLPKGWGKQQQQTKVLCVADTTILSLPGKMPSRSCHYYWCWNAEMLKCWCWCWCCRCRCQYNGISETPPTTTPDIITDDTIGGGGIKSMILIQYDILYCNDIALQCIASGNIHCVINRIYGKQTFRTGSMSHSSCSSVSAGEGIRQQLQQQ